MARSPKLTRAQRRQRPVPGAGAYGIDTRDAGADSWTGRYLFFARSPEEARSRVRDAGFHSKQIRARWAPGQEPPEGVPAGMGPGDEHWYRSRWDDNGWTAWERLPGDYRHPPQGRAAGDPSLR